VGSVVLLRWVDPPTSAFILRDRIQSIFGGSYKVEHDWTDWSAIASQMKVAVIASEDQKFPLHWGFDLEAIEDAMAANERGKRTRGASTISQQVAKNLFLWPAQNWFRKGLEAYFTLLIETFWSKQRILEVYLNVAEFGPGVYGVTTASQRYFGKQPARLSGSEAALLAAVLPNPKRYRAAAPSRYVRARQAWIQRQMRRLGGATYLRQLDAEKTPKRK
jgi:monofunctional biosynthetic peptidoglycan transglycosylase